MMKATNYPIGRETVSLVEEKGKKEVAVFTNPLGDFEQGFLHWERLEWFENKKTALKIIKNTQETYG